MWRSAPLSPPVGCWRCIDRSVSGAAADGVGWWSVVGIERRGLFWAVGPRPRSLELLTWNVNRNVFFSRHIKWKIKVIDCLGLKIDLISFTRHLCIFFTLPTFMFGLCSAQNGVRRSFHPAKSGHLCIDVVPWSWAGVDRDHYRNHIEAFRVQSNELNSKQILCLKKQNIWRHSHWRCSCGCGTSTQGCWAWCSHDWHIRL